MKDTKLKLSDMAGEDNLVSLADRTTEEKRAIGQKGGKASGEARRRTRSIREAIKILLETEQKEGRTGAENVAVGQYNRAIKGDTAAAKFLSEMVGEYKQLMDLTSGGKPFNVVVRDEQTKEDIDALK